MRAAAAGKGDVGLRVIGIDPGIATCGYGVIEGSGSARRPAVLTWGALRPEGEGAERLRVLRAGIAVLLAEHRPEAAAVERLFHTRNVRTAAAVGQARGVVLLACAEAGLEVAEYTPTELKLAVAGYGGADKRQVRHMVAAQLGLVRIPSPDDAADALGLCLCHLAGAGLRRAVGAGERP